MAGAVRASATDFNGAVDTTLAPSLAVNAGEFLVLQLSDRDATVSLDSVVSSNGWTWTLSRAAQISGNFRAVQYWAVAASTATETVTMTFGGTGVRGVATLSACTGVVTTSPVQTSGGSSNAAGTAHPCGSINAVAGLTFATFDFSGDEGAKTHTGYTEIANAHGFLRDYFSYRVNPGNETITSEVTVTNSVSGVGYHVNYIEAVAPTVTDVDTDESITGTQSFVITGTNFGSVQGVGTVRAYDPGGTLFQGLAVTSWADTSITATMSMGATPTGIRYGVGSIRVTTAAGFGSLATTFTVPSGVSSTQLSGTLAAGASVNAYALAQTYTSGVGLTLTAGAASISPPRRARITATTNESATNFTIVGTLNGVSVGEVLAGPNNTFVVSDKFYTAITSVTPNATDGVDQVQVGADTLRLEASPDIANTHQIEVSLVTGTGMAITDVTVNVDGSVTYSVAVTGFTWRSHNVTEGWGSAALFTVAVDQPPFVTTASLDIATQGLAYAEGLEATGVLPITWTSGTLPPGLTLNPDGGISGVPTTLGTTAVLFTATNVQGSGNRTVNITVNPVAPIVTTTSLASGYQNQAYSAQIYNSGGTSTYSVVAGAPPTGITLSAAGLLSGTPTLVETQAFTVRATNAADTDDQALSLTIAAVNLGAPILTPYDFGFTFE